MFSFGHHEFSYYTDFYDYATLKARAEELLGDTELTDAEKRMYYLTEE